jgi:hypothetical protein
VRFKEYTKKEIISIAKGIILGFFLSVIKKLRTIPFPLLRSVLRNFLLDAMFLAPYLIAFVVSLSKKCMLLIDAKTLSPFL